MKPQNDDRTHGHDDGFLLAIVLIVAGFLAAWVTR